MQEWEKYLDAFIAQALAEDVGDGDHSSNCCVPAGAQGKVQLLIKDSGVLAGVEVARRVFARVSPDIEFEPLLADGQMVNPGDIGFRLQGPVSSLLQGERLALNLMQRMSGIASKTRHLADKISDTSARLLDTRKTTPNLRPLEKWAVRLGGGLNHRMGLYDMIMLKDNHVDFAGGITAAVDHAMRYQAELGLHLPIEVETRNFKEIEELLTCKGVQRVMFDNFSPADTRQAVQMVNGQLETESSGGITEDTLRDYALTGVDFISVGALTHSFKSLDMSLKAYES